jgi:hypothetical protein
MAGQSINLDATLQCPHGGTVQIAGANVRASADGAFLAAATDVFTIKGCPYQIPATPPIPSPCTTVKWLVSDVQVKVGGNLVVSQSSGGLCLSAAGAPQGPVSVSATQATTESR